MTVTKSQTTAHFAFQLAAKQVFDILSSGVALVVLAPVFALIGLAIVINSPGPIFYKATRVGLKGKLFKMYKFRTMVVNADKIGPGLTVRNDQRITPIGRFLRKSKLDELPQLINVLRGDMSIVGPRPEDSRYVALYSASQRAVLNVRPGITSPASVHYRDESSLIAGPDWESYYIQEIMPNKLRLDIEYATQPSVARDLGVILKTIRQLWTK